MVATAPWYDDERSKWYEKYGTNERSKGKVRVETLPEFEERLSKLGSPSAVAGRMDRELAVSKTTATVTKEPTTKVTTSRIRVQLSRPLTWAEKEALETNNLDAHSRRINESTLGFKFHLASNMQHVWAEAGFGSRILYDVVAAALEQHFVNVYPTAVRTFREYNGK